MGLGITPSKEKRPTQPNTNAATATTNNVSKVGSGFVLTSSNDDGVVSDDPMVQQIRNLRGFIAEAKRLGRYDEVAALEDNLGELQVREMQRMRSSVAIRITHSTFQLK